VLPPGQAAALARHAQRHTQARLVAEKVETAEQHMHIANCGVQLFQGYWFARPALVEARLLAPAQASIVQLINLVRQQASTDAIEEVLKKDAGLAFNLMRLINSAGFGLQREITSFKQAVMLLGLKKLFRWAALLLTVSRQGGAPPAAGQTAVVRARLMELLALETMSQDEADLAFVAGIFSLLGAMLGLPQEQALHLVSMPEPMATAVLRHDGPLGALLTLAEACEASDDALFDRAAATLHLTSQQINLAHLQALAWSDQVAVS
jgi:c-di-GMP-related signal transduction protein